MSSRTPLNTITFNRESRFSNQTLPFPEDYLNFGIPVATSSTTFTISKCYARNVTDSYNIYISLPTIINVASYGVLNGQCIGNFYIDTVRVTSGSSSITSNSPDIYLSLIFNVGDLITIKSGQSTYTSLVTEIIDNYNIIISGVLPFTSTNANFRRGGSQLGLVPDTKLYFYALGHSVSPGYILTTRNVMNGDKLTDLPTGYYVENSRQLPYYVVVSGNGIIYDAPIALSWNETSSGIITRFANQEETVKGHEKYKAITPSTLGAAIANLNNISEILGIFASDSDALSMVATTKAVTPANIKQLFNTPPAIGSSTPNVGSFTTLTASDITGNAIVDSANIDPNSSKLITMNTLSSALEYANTLGSSSNYVSSSYINSLNVKTLSGSGIVSSLGSTYSNPQKSMPTDINHVLSVAGNVQLLSQPTAIGNISPNTGNFTSLTAKTIYGQVGDSNSYSTGRFSSLTVDSISGNFVASNQDATDMSSATKVLTPSTLPSILSNPSDIGNITPSTGTFTTLKADQLGGNIVASDIDALNKVSITKCITPKNIAAILADPGTIGSKNPGIGKFSSITVDNITVANSLTLLKPNGFSFGYMVTCIPKKITPINATTDSITLFSIRYCYARNETNNADIIMSVPSLVDVYEANGLINGMCRSAPLGGTVSVVAGSNIVYGTGNCNFVSDFILGDTVSVGSEIKKIIGINSNTGITSQHLIVGSNFQNTYSGIGYYRGGAGLGSLAPNIYYHIYILGSNLTTGLGTPGYVLSTRNVMDGETLVDLPFGYSTANYRQLPYSFYTDSSGLLSTDASPYFAKDSSSGAFLRPAKDQEVIDKKLTYVSVTPASLPKIMANPGPIGSDVPNTGTFTTLAAKSITGECIAKFEDFSTFSKSNRVIVPSSIPYIFANPPALGTTVPAKGTFTTLQANQVTGKCIATDDEVRLKSSTTKLVTPSSLSIILASPGVIGGTTSSDAYFKTVSSQTLNSNVINVPSTGAVNISADANFNGALYGNVVSANKYLGIIGDPVSKNNAYFTNLQADAISGPFLANNADIIARTSTTKLVTPANLQTLFENPPVIGKTTPTTGYFTSIHADSITVAYPISQRAQLPVMYMTSSDVYTTNFYEFTVQYCYARSLDDSLDILINTPKTINIRNQNVINGVCKSSAMPGTVNVASGSNVVSGSNTTFNYTFIVGDVISLGGQSYLVSTIDPNSQTLTVDRNVHFTSLSSVYYRGGADTLLPNKIYYFYAVGHSTTPCYMISTRSTDIGETLVDLPTGYNVAYSRQLPYAVQTNSTGTISDQPRPLSSFESSSSITQVASNLEAIQKLNSFKALTPSNIPSFMSVPGPIGNQTPSTGSFTDLTANTIGGSCLATLDDINNGVNNKIVTPASLATLFDSPSTIGSQTPSDAYFNSLTVNNPLQVNDTSLATSFNNASIITKGGMSVSQNLLVGTTITTQGKATFNDQVNITSTSVSNSSTTGALTVAGGVGIKGDLNVNGTANFNSLSLSGNFNVPSTTSTTTTTEGALTVAGGVGIKGNIISGGQTYIKNITDSNNTTSGALIVSGGTGIAGNATIGGSTSIGKDLLVSGQTSLTSTTDSNSTNNGSLIISGGIGIAKAVNIGGLLKVNSDSVFSSTTDSASPAGSTGSLTTKGGLGITKNAVIGGQLKVESTTQSTSISTGAAVVSGGLGVGKNLNVGGSISTSGSLSIGGSFSINSGFESNDTQSGALVITGGIGVSGSANVGGNTNISGVTTSKSIIVTSTQKGNTSGTGAITVAGGIGIGDNSTFGKNVSIIGTLSTSGQTTILNNTSSALSITGGAVVGTTLSTGGDLTIGGGATITNSTKITSTNSSTSTDTGALIVSGGVGIKENLTVGGGLNVTGSINMANINVTGTTSATNSLTGALKVAGGISTKENLVVDQNLNVNGKSVFVGDNRINSSTSSTNITSGALTVAGGVGIAGDIYVGNNINVGTNAVIQGATTIQGVTNINNTLNVTGKTSITDTTQSTSTTSGALTIAGGTGIKGALMVGGTTNLKGFTTIEAGTSITNTTNANDSSSGALTVAGGIGVIKDSHLGGNVSVYGTLKGKNTTNSTTSSTGAMIIEGGVGMAKDLHVGGSIYSEGSAYLGGLENNVKLTGGAPGTTPFIKSFSDSDTNVDLKIQPQGFGRTYVVSDLIVTGAFSAASITGANPSAALPRGYFYISKPPIYLTTSTYNIPDIIARNYNNSANLFVNATNVSINNIDVINGIMTTLMTGTVTVTSGSSIITGTGTSFTTDFVNGDIININGECQVIAEIQSDTSLLVVNPYTTTYTDQPYKLNGKCANANYYVYLVNNATSSAPGFILTSKIYTEGQTLLSVPANYSNIDYRIVPYKLTTDSFGNFVQTPTSLSGGLGVSNMTKGALIVGTSSGGAQTLKVGSDGQILSLSNGVPTWITGSFDSSPSYKVTGTTEATSTTTGALLVEGGVGIKGSLYVGGDLGLDGANFNTIEGSVVAHNSDLTLTGSSPDNLVITPLGLYNVLTSPPVIGDLVQNDAKFNDIKGNTVSGNMIATSSDITSSGPTNKIITPFTLAEFFADPTIDIGSNGRSSAFFENLDTNSISGNVFSSISDFGATPSSTKVVSPSVLTTFLTKPSDIGTVTPGNAYFKELGFTNIASANIASVSDIQTGTSNSTVLTPSSFAAIFKSPIALGSDNPNSGKFTTLNANVYYGSIGSSSTYSNAYVDTLNAKNISGDLIPTDITDLKTNNSNSKVVTPYLLSQYFTSLPSTIGDGSTSAIFDNVSVNSLSGSVFATKAEVIAASSSTKIVSPSTLNNLLTVSPPVIGSSNPAAGTFTALNANQIYGQLGSTNNKSNVYSAVLYFDEFNPNSGGLGTISDVQQGTSGKFVDTSVIKDLFANPLPIGSTSSAAGTFSTLKATNASLTNALPVTSGGTGLQTITTGDLLYGSATDTISSLDVGTENQFLKVNSGGLPEWSDLPITYTNLKLTDTTASTSTQTGSLVIAGGVGIGGDVNVKGYVLANSLALTSPLSVDSGGLGLSTISNGDLLYGSNSNSVSKLGIGSNGQILSINSGLPKWINAPSTTSTTNLTISNSSGTTLNVSSNDSAAVTVTGGVSANSLTLTTALPVTSGGLGFGSVAAGDLIYGSASNTLGKLSKGTDGQILTLASGVPSWINAPSTTSTTNLTISNSSGTTLNVSSNDSSAVSVTGGISANSLALTTALPVTSGGLGFGSVAAGDLIYGSGTNTLGKLSKGTDGQILTLASGVPLWTNAPSTTSTTNLTISNNSGTTLTISSSDSAAVSVTGGVSANSLALTTALPVTSGGTGFGSVATGDLIYGSGTNILGKISKGTDGQILSLASGVPSWTNAPSTTSTTSLSITNTTASNSTTSGSLIVAGGTGIAGNIYGGANGNINGQLTVTGSTVLTVPAATGVSYLNLSYSLGTDLSYSVFDGNVAKFESNSTDTCSMGFPTNTATYASSSWTIEIPVVFYNLDQDMSVIRSTNGSNVLDVTFTSKVLGLSFNNGSTTTSVTCSPNSSITNTWGNFRLSLLVLQWTGTKIHLTFFDRGMTTTPTPTTFTASVNCSVNMINGLTLRNPATSGWKFYVDAIRISNTARYVDGSGNQTSITYTGSPLTSDSNTVYINNMDGIPGPNAPWTPGTITTSIASTSPTTGSLVVSGGIGIGGSSYIGSNLNVSGALTLGSALPVTSGGTGISSIASGDIIYGSASNTLSSLTKGTDGQILTLASGKPSWANAPSNTSTTNLTISNTTGTTLTVSSSASNAVSVTGGISSNSLALTTALPVTSGGTGLASLTTGDILYASASNTLSKLGKGTDGQILTLASGVPSWANASGATSTTSLSITDTTDSSSTTTGALKVAGGASVQKNLYIGSSLAIAGTGASSSTTTGAVTIVGGVGIQGTANINVLALPTTTGTTLTVSSTQASSSTTTGAMTVAGGVGIQGTANINTLVLPTTTGTTLTVSSTQASSSTTTGAITVAGGIGVKGTIYTNVLALPTTTGTTLTVSSTQASSSTTTGAVTITGGIGISGSAYVNSLTLPTTTGTTLTVSSTAASSSTTTGAATIAGGLGVAGNIYGGNNGNIYGQLTVSGNSTITAAAATGTSASNINTISSSLMGFATEGTSGEFNSIPSSMTLPTNTSTYTSTAWTLEIPIILSGLSSSNTLTLLRSVNGANIFEVYITTRRIGIKFNDGSTTTTVPASPAVDLIEVTQNYRLSCLYLQWTGTKIQFTFIDRGMTTSSITTFTASLNCSVNMINGMVLANQSGIQYQFYVDTIRISNIARYVDGSGNQTAITYNGSILSNDSNTVYITRMDTATPTWTAGTIIGTITATNATTGGLIVNGGIGVTGISYFGNGLSVTDSTVSSSTSTGAVTITGGVGIQGTANINSLSLPTTTGTTLTVSSTQASSSTTTGAMTVAGGIGVKGTINANTLALPITTGTTLTVSSNQASSSTSTGAAVITGGLGVQGTANINTLTLPTTTGTTLTVSSTQASSSTTTGSVKLAGGIGIQGALYASSGNFTSTTDSTTSSTGAIITAGGIGVAKNIVFGGTITGDTTSSQFICNGTGDASGTSTGSIQTLGGMSCVKNMYVGGNITGSKLSISDTTNASSTTTGAVVITGGAGIGGTMYTNIVENTGGLRMNNNILNLRDNADSNNYVKYDSTLGGAMISGTSGGQLKSASGADLKWKPTGISITGGGNNTDVALYLSNFGTAAGYGVVLDCTVGVSTGAAFMSFRTSGSDLAAISYNGSNGIDITNCTVYAPSDYRLKEDIEELPPNESITRIMATKPVSYKWIDTKKPARGFIAHELTEAGFENVVHGEKDAVDDDGNILPQNIDVSAMTPDIVSVLQYLIKENADLKRRLEALEKKM